MKTTIENHPVTNAAMKTREQLLLAAQDFYQLAKETGLKEDVFACEYAMKQMRYCESQARQIEMRFLRIV